MPVLSVLATASVLAAVTLVAPAGAAAAAPGIVVLNVTGSGCRPNSTAAALSPNRTSLTIIYSDYLVAAAGRTGKISKNCRINLKVETVPGFAPTIASVDYRGFADIAPGSVAELKATYGFHGASHVDSAALRRTGPLSDNWQTTDTSDGGLVTGKCKGSNVLDVDSTLSLTSTPAGASTDAVAMDSTDGQLPNEFHLTWNACS